jgi:predicted membrane-bound dolichyl-phosphate-mannose-protein mannosyltransferase
MVAAMIGRPAPVAAAADGVERALGRAGRWSIVRPGSLPVLLLVVVSCVSIGARVAWLGAPCHAPCRSSADHVLIFDERYYINAARVIAGIRPPRGAPYADAPLGVDPNAEHPPLAKLIIAGSIELLGDGPLAWRLGSVVMGTLAILGMFVLVRGVGGGRWLAFAAAALMAADNLLIVHGRIGTLDVYALAAMVWAAALYVRGHPLAAGALTGIGLCAKVVVAYVLLAFVVYETLLWMRDRDRAGARAWRVSSCIAVAGALFVGLMALLERVSASFDDAAHKVVAGGPLGEIAHIFSYAAAQRSPHGPTGIASYPWGWLVDYKPIAYLNINPAKPAPGLYGVYPAVHFLGLISPPILLLALPALALAGRQIFVHPFRANYELPALAIAWVAGTFLPFVFFSLALHRTTYLYYMVVVMPGVYVAVAWLLPRLWRWRKLTVLWIAMVAIAAVIAYPLTPLP